MLRMVAVVGDAATFVREGFDGKGQRGLLAELFALLASQGCIQTGLKIGASITDCQRVCLSGNRQDKHRDLKHLLI